MINILYGILVPDTVQGYYKKQCVHPMLTAKGIKLRNMLLTPVVASKVAEFGCFICSAVQSTVFWPEIKRLDASNTYAKFMPDPSSSRLDSVLYDCIQPIVQIDYTGLLDADIEDKLMLPTWLDVAGGICLQLLREVQHG